MERVDPDALAPHNPSRAGQREDYLMRMTEELCEFVARAVLLRDTGQLAQALQIAVQAQERLFARPAAEFAALPVDEQLRLLTLDESPDQARAKCLAYASILEEAGNVYQARGRDDLAASALQLALYVTADRRARRRSEGGGTASRH